MSKILVCNQKMFLTFDEAKLLSKEMVKLDFKNLEVIVCPSYLNFDIFNNFKLCSQDVFYEDKGAYTGKISAYDLSLRNIKYSLVGHSEVRDLDSDEIINLKIKALLRNLMTPILCIGETKNEYELRKTSFVLRRQIKKAFKDIKLENDEEVLIAYEPRFLIGGKKVLSIEEIDDVMNYIRKILEEENIYNYKLLYGGAVNSNNIKEISNGDFDGFLLGNSSINIDELNDIINCIK